MLHPDLRPGRSTDASFSLDEAVSLTRALELAVVGAHVVTVQQPRAGTLFGPGKVDELGEICAEHEIELVIVDGPVTPVQQRNLEKAWQVKLLDRTGLILEIFADRAATREGVLQVDLAALSYQKSRLVRSWTHLERQRGGLGFVGGPGETQIEADRRAIDAQIGRIRKALTKVVKTRSLHRAARKKVPYPIVALVGYTNAGKSTLFNRLTGADVLAKDMLFATLDPTMRAVRLASGPEVILSDTVGFISDLPTQLVAAFRATLEEVLDADLILHVRDISHPRSDEQAQDVHTILEELGVDEDRRARMLEVWNKTDLLPPQDLSSTLARAERSEHVYPLSAVTGAGQDALLQAIASALRPDLRRETLHLPFEDSRRRAWLFRHHLVEGEDQSDTGYALVVAWTAVQRAQFMALDETTEPS
ncbi:MAG: GTPase HflX [Pseudomonadota bacterium]